MAYIHRYAARQSKIPEVDAGTGRYSIAFAREGMDVTAVELVGNNPAVLRENSKGIDADKLRTAFRCCLDSQQKALTKERRKNAIKQMWMFGIGVLLIGIGLIASDRFPELPGEIISTIGAFSMWEAASIRIIENPKNRISRRWLNVISKTEILCDKVYESGASKAKS